MANRFVGVAVWIVVVMLVIAPAARADITSAAAVCLTAIGQPGPEPENVIPEPASILVWCVLGAAGTALAWRWRKRRGA